MTSLTNKDIDLLRNIVTATQFGSIAYATAEAGTPLLMEELVDCNAQMVNISNTAEIAFRARQSGIDFIASLVPAAPTAFAVPAGFAAPAPIESFAPPVGFQPAPEQQGFVMPSTAPVEKAPPEEPSFTVGSGFVVPAKVRRSAARSSTYGDAISRLGVNEYIFIASTEDKPDPRKSLGSTITAQNKRYVDFNPRRYFQLFRAAAGQQFGSVIAPSDGVYIVRTDAAPVKQDVE